MRPSTLLPLVLLTACRVLPEPANSAVVDDVHSFSEPNRVAAPSTCAFIAM
jgi:hypothetical protein